MTESNLRAEPLAVDLFCGLGGWAEGLLAEGYHVVGFDIERHEYGEHRYPGRLVIQDVRTLNGAQFKDAALIVASPPCQFFSYTSMPWSRAKKLATEVRADPLRLAKELELFDACFRIQREACAAAGRHIPMVVENVRRAIPWVGRSRWNYGSFHLWGDVPALMPITAGRPALKVGVAHRADGATNFHGHKVPSFRFDGSGKSFQSASVEHSGAKNTGGSWFNVGSPGQKVTGKNPVHELSGVKCGGDWFNSDQPSISRKTSSKSPARKAASALIAKIPVPLARHIARTFHPARAAA